MNYKVMIRCWNINPILFTDLRVNKLKYCCEYLTLQTAPHIKTVFNNWIQSRGRWLVSGSPADLWTPSITERSWYIRVNHVNLSVGLTPSKGPRPSTVSPGGSGTTSPLSTRTSPKPDMRLCSGAGLRATLPRHPACFSAQKRDEI